MQIKKEYLGDGVYASYDGFYINLTTENGIEVTNKIYLEDTVIASLERFIKKVKESQAS